MEGEERNPTRVFANLHPPGVGGGITSHGLLNYVWGWDHGFIVRELQALIKECDTFSISGDN